jgi:hypothetical protein
LLKWITVEAEADNNTEEEKMRKGQDPIEE